MSAKHPEPDAQWFTLDGRACVSVEWGGRRVHLYRSPTGRSFRIFVDGREWKAVQA